MSPECNRDLTPTPDADRFTLHTRRPEPVKHGLTYPDQARRFEDRATMAADQRALRIANERSLSLGKNGDDGPRSTVQTSDRAEFLHVFNTVRRRTLAGEDTYLLYRTFVQDLDGSVAEAAYIEAVASTRTAVRSMYAVKGR